MYILGVNISHHASVCLLKDGKVLFYLEDDRLSRNKEAMFLFESKLLSLKKVGEYTNHVDHIIFCSYGRSVKGFSPGEAFGGRVLDDQQIVRYILRIVEEKSWFRYDEIHFLQNEHHLYHAYNAFYSTNFEKAAALVMDGGGNLYPDSLPSHQDFMEIKSQELEKHFREVETMYSFDSKGSPQCLFKHYASRSICRYHRPSQLNNIFFSSSLSCGALFGDMASCVGLFGSGRRAQSGKMMGLSSYGERVGFLDEPWFNEDKKTGIWVTDNDLILKIFCEKYPLFYHKLLRCYSNRGLNPSDLLDDMNNEEFDAASSIARKIQEETKLHTIRLIKKLLDMVDTNNIVLSGGYFLNCVNNYEYIKEFPEVNFYIDPIAHDGGTAMGAARYVWHHILKKTKRYPLDSLLLG